MLEGRKRKLERATRTTRSSSPKTISPSENGPFRPPNEDNIMTRKPIRIRRPRIPILQSGYCAICNLPYNNVDDHVQSKKHQKLIGEDANYIALNGYVGIDSLLSLTGFDAIGFDDFSPKTKRRNMPRTRASSVMSDIVKPTLNLENDSSGHRLRSKKNVNYLTPPLDEDSFQDKPPDLEPVRLEYKEYRELRSSTRALAKLTACTDPNEPALWDSGRPKRACINRHKRLSADERLAADNKTYYKVEVLSSKVTSNDKDAKTGIKPKEPKSSDSDKLIVKFKKLRNTELVQLNNEATNFLFPKKDDSTEDEDDEDDDAEEDGTEEVCSSSEQNEVSSSSELEEVKPPDKFKVEDDASMDSISSECKPTKKRRTHAEAFIMDNQKYYKFETPGSSSYRLRYHGSYLSPVPPKVNGDLTKSETEAVLEPKLERDDKGEEETDRLTTLNLDEFTFAFETVPENEKWYQTFRRHDRSEQRYDFCPNYHWNDFVLPSKIPNLKAIDPRLCIQAYKILKESISTAVAKSKTGDVSSDSEREDCEVVDEPEEDKTLIEQTDEDSKSSEISSASAVTTDENRRRKKTDVMILSPSSGRGRNPRKSPRQHASTLAILSSLVHQRKRRSKNSDVPDTNLQTIPEEPTVVKEEEQKSEPLRQKPRKKKIDYVSLAAQIDDEFTTAIEKFDWDFQPTTNPDVSFLDFKPTVNDIMRIYDECNEAIGQDFPKKVFNGAAGRKPAKRKKNLTGWPNKVKRKRVVKDESENIKDGNLDASNDEPKEELTEKVNEVKCDQDNIENRVGNGDGGENRVNHILQPYVYVKKLDNCDQFRLRKILIKSPANRTVQRRKKQVISTNNLKSPRMLRKPKGRWYKDR